MNLKQKYLKLKAKSVLGSHALFKENKSRFRFYKSLAAISFKGFLYSAILLFIFIGLDHLISYLILTWVSDPLFYYDPKINSIVENKSPLKLNELSYFVEVVNIVGGVLGVLLGLFFTSFVTIVDTKYSDVNPQVRELILKNKDFNRYFTLIAVLTCLSLLLQLTLSFGYKPTVTLPICYVLVVCFVLLSFVKFGKMTLSFFDRSILTHEIFSKLIDTINLIGQQARNIEIHNREKQCLKIINTELNNLEIVLEVCSLDDAKNHSLDRSVKNIFDFFYFFNQRKYTIPSYGNWQTKLHKHKLWTEASASELKIARATGTNLIPKEVVDYNWVEKRLIKSQFKFLKGYLNVTESYDKVIGVLADQIDYLQTVSFQNEDEIFELYFDSLSDFIFEVVTDERCPEKSRVLMVSLFDNFIINYLVGLNHNLKIYTANSIHTIAYKVNNNTNFIDVMPLSYSLRIWIDRHIQQLKNEIEFNKRKVTTTEYTTYELSNEIASNLTKHYIFIIDYCFKNVIKFIDKLESSKLKFEALNLAISSIELTHKLLSFTESVDIIIRNLPSNGFLKEKSFVFSKRDKGISTVKQLKELLTERIWNLGGVSYMKSIANVPDTFGHFYQIIHDDVINKLLNDNSNIIGYLKKYFGIAFLYIETIRSQTKFDEENELVRSVSKAYPLIVDLLDTSSIAIIVSRVTENEALENSIFEFWNELFKNEKEEVRFWQYITSVNDYFGQPLYTLSTNSYEREQYRERVILEYLIHKKIIRKEQMTTGGFKSHAFHWVTDMSDLVIITLASMIHEGRISPFMDLREVFVEHFLNTRICLKELKYNRDLKYAERLYK